MKKIALSLGVLTLGAALLLGAGCVKNKTATNEQNVNAETANTTDEFAIKKEQKGPGKVTSTLNRFFITLPENMYLCDWTEKFDGQEPVFAVREGKQCADNGDADILIRYNLNTSTPFSLEDAFDALYANQLEQEFGTRDGGIPIRDIRDVKSREYLVINNQKAMKVFLPKAKSFAVTMLSNGGSQVTTLSFSQVADKTKENSLWSIVNSFEFKDKDI